MTDLPKVPEPKAKPKPIKGGVKGQAMELYQAEDWPALAAFKKAKKKSWNALGFTSVQEGKILKKI